MEGMLCSAEEAQLGELMSKASPVVSAGAPGAADLYLSPQLGYSSYHGWMMRAPELMFSCLHDPSLYLLFTLYFCL